MRPPSQLFGEDITNQTNNEEPDPRMISMLIYTRLAGRAVTRVVERCNDAKENSNLDLSNCQLMQVPDAVYHLMRHTELKSCDLSDNDITKIPPKFTTKFSLIRDLNMAHNQIAKLPDEIAQMGNLQRLDISYNTFIALPSAIFRIPNLIELVANNNHIVDIEVELLQAAPALEKIDLASNPITRRSHELLSSITKIKVTLSSHEEEEWEDLTI